MTIPSPESPIIRKVVNQLMAYDPERIILFGSAARGDADTQSDIDLVIVKQTSKRFVQRLVEAASFIRENVSVDLFVYTPEELEAMAEEGNPLIERALAEGRTVYEKTARSG